jgi:putative ABC transport system ATP-binding protein
MLLDVIDVTVKIPVAGGCVTTVLDRVSLRFCPGRAYAISGASGSGKTSLIHLLAGIILPTAGHVRFGDEVTSDLPEGRRDAWRHRHCGLIFQDFRLLEELGPLSNVQVPSWFGNRQARIPPHRAGELLEELGVPLDRGSVAKLSRGEQQRVALARALLADPEIVLADEPTASLDDTNAANLVDRLTRLASQGKVVVCATHDQRIIAKANDVVRLENGRVVEETSR